jgi:acylphosphatase
VSEEKVLQRRYRITGRVQGVYFRAWTQETARELGVAGTVRNRSDGCVEAHARGEASALAELERRLWQGPPSARVDGVEAFEFDGVLPDGPFQIR